MTGAWDVATLELPTADLHALGVGEEPVLRQVRLCRPTAAALVLGSTQTEPPLGPLALVRRRGGGGAVVVEPGKQVWIDVVVPRGDGLWDDDVGRAFLWLGEVWARTLAALGVAGGRVHGGAAVRTRWCRAVCFAGLGAGEVTAGGRKAVGISQRRTRHAALFQSALLRSWDPQVYVDALGLPPEAASDLAGLTMAFPDLTIEAVETAFVDHLPR